jgi:LPS-assembly protein
VKFEQGYDLRNEMSDEPFTPLQMESGFYPVRNFRMKYTNKTDMYGDGLFYHAVETDYFSKRGDILGLDYRYDSVRDINSISGSIWYLLPYNFAAGYSLERAIETEVTIEEKIRLIYQPACWSVELSSNYTPDDQIFMVTFRLANIGSPFGIDLPGGN